MLAVLACLVGVLAILTMAEMLWRTDILKGEYQRKFVHVPAAAFFAIWPWLLSWRQIQLLGLAMMAVLGANKFDEVLHFSADLRKQSLGGVCLALAVVSCALITTNKLFFAIALLHVSLADGFAAIIGTRYGAQWQYRAFGQLKTVIGTMTFWLASLLIFGIGLLTTGVHNYGLILLLLPPLLAGIENITPYGLDNITVPLTALLILQAAAA